MRKITRTLPKRITRFILFVFVTLSLWQCSDSASGPDSYPTRPITYIVPWAAGGMTDMTSRVMGAVLQNVLGQPVNVVNRTGGGGVVGHLAISQAQPDGYTVGAVTVEITMLHHTGLTPLTPENYTPLALLVNNPAAITVRADAPWDSLPQLLNEIKARPGELQASGTAKDGIWDLARRGFLKAAGLPESALPWVPSQGASPALQELLADGVQVVTASLTEVDALRKAGQVKTLAVMADERLAGFPNVPTLKEYGLDWSIGGWVTISAPAGLAPEIKAKLDSAIQVAVRDTMYTNALKSAGANLQFLAGQELDRFMEQQDKLNGELMGEEN